MVLKGTLLLILLLIKHITQYRGSSLVDDFVSKVSMLKSDSPLDVVTTTVVALLKVFVTVGRDRVKSLFTFIRVFLLTST